ncbi:MAG: hypothetical protein J6O50_10110 [Ruminiclostridium sp.]|nr:hypothetical protein [Ruminiclostridium sp.]
MYNVSQDYIDALAQKTVRESISGTLILPEEENITIDDDRLVKGSLKLTKELCGEKYRIGTFNLSCLKFSFFTDSAQILDLTGGRVSLEYRLYLPGNEYETVPLGTFLVDPILSSRRKNIISIVAYDNGIKADREPSAQLRNMSGTPAQLIIAACEECGIPTEITEHSLDSFPNSSVTVNAKDKQIQSCRDIIMWCAYLLCSYAVIDRNSELAVIPAKYSVNENSSTIDADRTVSPYERQYTYATDTRAYIKYMSAYRGDSIVNYTSTYISTDEQAAPAAYVLDKNPLLAECSETVQDTANRSWLAYIDSFKQRGIKTRIYGDPAIDPGDTLLFRGGDIDQRQGIIGVVTSYEWNYRAGQVINCCAADCVGSLINGQTVTSTQTRSQTQKRIDAVEGTGSGGVGENVGQHNERFNGYTDTDGSAITGGDYNHAENYKNTLTNCNKSSAGGSENLLNDCTNTLVHGYKNKVYSNSGSVIAGNENIVTPSTGQRGNLCVGESIEAHIHCSSVTGHGHKVTGSYQNVSGEGHTVGGEENIVGGQGNKVQGTKNTVGGTNNTVTGVQNLVGGADNTVSGNNSGCVGGHHKIGDEACFAAGYGTDTSQITTGNVRLIVGNGTGNSFYVTAGGEVYAIGGYNSLGADYAEYFEWADGNPDNEDRRGMLVSLAGDKILPADGNGFSGIVSACPSVVGNSAETHWKGKYITDMFGCIRYGDDGVPLISDDYDPALTYIPRSQRPEWAAVGLTGRLIAADDGSCTVGGFCTAKNGIAAGTKIRTRAKMLRRIDGSHIEVLIR